MKLNAFITKCTRHVDAYFEAIEAASGRNEFFGPDHQPASPVYPTMLLVCETDTHFVAELLGASLERPTQLIVVNRALPDVNSVLGRFPTEETRTLLDLQLGGGGNGVAHLALLCERNRDLFESRYPELRGLHDSALVYNGALGEDEAFYPFRVPTDFRDLWLTDVLTVANWRGQVRARYFQSAWLTEVGASSSELQRRLEAQHPVGVDTSLLAPSIDAVRTLAVRAANFASLSSIDKVGETTITKFLELNETILLAALDAVKLIPQPYFPWMEGNPDPSESAIQPDFLAVDADGQAHLCEVKLPLLGRMSLTTGGHRRREFVRSVSEGVAQLANYREYFCFPSHQAVLRDKHGVSIDDPRGILIVGSAENFDAEEVRQAQRMLRPVEVLDYDTLRALYLAKSGYVPGGRLDDAQQPT